MSASILIVEDEPSISELLSVNARHAGYHPLPARDVDNANALLREVLPDLIILDWMLPGMSGLAFLRCLRADVRTRDVPVIMLTARTEEQDLVDGLEAGADDYLTKPFSPKELMARVRAVLRRQAPQMGDDVVSINGLTLDPSTRRVQAAQGGGEVRIQLGPTEFRLLHFFMTRPERVHSRSLVLEAVWGNHVLIEERTVDVHIKRLRDALKPAGYDTFIETVRGSGYRLSRITTARQTTSAA
jgi:two-component system phosphate regulon response regulator PhoB